MGFNSAFKGLIEWIKLKVSQVNDKGKVNPRTGHGGPEGEQMYSSTLPSTSALDK